MLDEDAKMFLQFQEHYEFFRLLIDRKVHQQKGAAITLHLDNKGVIRTITRADVLYTYGSQFDNLNEKIV